MRHDGDWSKPCQVSLFCRISVIRLCSADKRELFFQIYALGICLQIFTDWLLHENIIVEPRIPMQNSHKTCHFRPMGNMIRRITVGGKHTRTIVRTIPHPGKGARNEIMYQGCTLSADAAGTIG